VRDAAKCYPRSATADKFDVEPQEINMQVGLYVPLGLARGQPPGLGGGSRNCTTGGGGRKWNSAGGRFDVVFGKGPHRISNCHIVSGLGSRPRRTVREDGASDTRN
jgi:hypothetical protein